MALRILMVWELGGGFGHLSRLEPVGRRLSDAGHDVLYALQQIDRGVEVLGDQPLLQSPLVREIRQPLPKLYTLADILHNAGGGDPRHLRPLLRAWRTLIDLVKPDVVVGDYAPFLLAATRGLPIRKAVITNGFDVPPDTDPLAAFRVLRSDDERDAATARERQVLQSVNTELEALGSRPLSRLAELLHDVDCLALATLPEFDPYPGREDGQYWGGWGRIPAAPQPPRWPRGDGPKLFAYLKPCNSLDALLGALGDADATTVAYVASPAASALMRFETSRLTIVTRPVAITSAAAEADAVICHAGNNTVLNFALRGRAVFALPLHTEQNLLAVAAVRAGLGVKANPAKPEEVRASLAVFLSDFDRHRAAARAFAQRYAGFDADAQVDLLAQQIVSG